MKSCCILLLSIAFVLTLARADGPGDNLADKVRRVPPPGVAVSQADQTELSTGLEKLTKDIDALREQFKSKPELLDLLPDVQVYLNAVRYALVYNEFFNANEIPVAKTLLKQGFERAAQLRDGKSPWTTASGLVVRGYVSKIDGSVQPYGLVVPTTYQPGAKHHHRLDIWFHGRGEVLSELNFINGRQRSPGEFTPRDAFVLHPYGRYCNANKFAGEIDTFEAMAHVRKHYPIDENRIAVRGFSMGGAACWQFAVHYPGLWCAAAPGAGFAETPEFLRVFQKEDVSGAPPWEKKLWHMYDSTNYALNIFNLPTVAYSGENDSQKQAADIMAKAMKAEGLDLVHIIGPKTGHSYEKGAKAEVVERIDKIVDKGRNLVPEKIKFVTYTLRYNQCSWIKIDALEQHWARAQVEAHIVGSDTVKLATKNIGALTLDIPQNDQLNLEKRLVIEIDDQKVELGGRKDRNGACVVRLEKKDRQWASINPESPADFIWTNLRKRHGLQGPIDDAFMDSFVMVRPTGKPLNDKVGAWANAEMEHAIVHWRRQFRGDARVKADTDITDADIASSNLVLWGDPTSNTVLAKIASKLPIRWDEKQVRIGEKTYDAGQHVPVMIYPNPLNPKRYVVVNSGFTFREYDYLNNARQVPKLPDYAVIDVSKPMTSRAPGGIVTAGFFGERWELLEGK